MGILPTPLLEIQVHSNKHFNLLMTNELCMLYVCNNKSIWDQLNRQQSTPNVTLLTIVLDEFEAWKGWNKRVAISTLSGGSERFSLAHQNKSSHQVHPICKIWIDLANLHDPKCSHTAWFTLAMTLKLDIWHANF